MRAAGPVCCSGWDLSPGLGGRGVHSGRNSCPDPVQFPHHGRRFCMEHGPSAQPSHDHPVWKHPRSHRGHTGPVPEGLSHLRPPLPQLCPAAVDEHVPGEGARRPGPSAALGSAGTPPPASRPLTAAVLAGCRLTCPDTARPAGSQPGRQPRLSARCLSCVFLGQDDPFPAFITFSE